MTGPENLQLTQTHPFQWEKNISCLGKADPTNLKVFQQAEKLKGLILKLGDNMVFS